MPPETMLDRGIKRTLKISIIVAGAVQELEAFKNHL